MGSVKARAGMPKVYFTSVFAVGFMVLLLTGSALADCPGGQAPAGSTVVSTTTGPYQCNGELAYRVETTRYLAPAGYTCDVKANVRDSGFDIYCIGKTPETPTDTPTDTGTTDTGKTDTASASGDKNEFVMTDDQWQKIKQYYAEQAALGGADSRMTIISDDQFYATYGMINVLGGLKGSIEALIPKRETPSYMKYNSSDLPQWDFGVSISGSAESSDISTAASAGRESDSRSLSIGLSAEKEKLRLDGQFRYRSLKGTGANDGNDSDEYSLMVMAGYHLLSQADSGFDLKAHLFMDLATNDYGPAGDQFRYTPGLGISAGGATPVGAFQLAYMFSHDRNADGDTEITGEEYLNINTLSLAYLLPLTRSLAFRSSLNYLYIMDMPSDEEEDSANVDLGFNYTWKQYWMGISVVKSFTGYDREGLNFSAGYYW